MKRTLIRIICWVLFAWFFYYLYYFVILGIDNLIWSNLSDYENISLHILAGVLDIITVLVIYGEKIRKDIKESICLKTSDENKGNHL